MLSKVRPLHGHTLHEHGPSALGPPGCRKKTRKPNYFPINSHQQPTSFTVS